MRKGVVVGFGFGFILGMDKWCRLKITSDVLKVFVAVERVE